jgi:YD repeat-containing protein
MLMPVNKRYSYANRGRNITFTDGKGNSFLLEKNAFAEMTGETNRLGDRQSYGYDSEGRLINTTAYSGKQVRRTYADASGVTTTEYSDGSRTRITRNLGGDIVKVEGATGTIHYRYDAGRKLIGQTDDGAEETTTYEYNAAGQRIRMLSGNRDVRYWYGKNGELTRVLDNTQRLEVFYTYNDAGQEVKRVYGNGVTQETAYDAAGRTILITEWAPNGAGAGRNILRAEAYAYDTKGRRTHSVDEEGKVTRYEYDIQS